MVEQSNGIAEWEEIVELASALQWHTYWDTITRWASIENTPNC